MGSEGFEVWSCDRAALVGGVSVLRDRVRLLGPPGGETDVSGLPGGLALFRTRGFDWDSNPEEGPWMSAVVLRSFGHRLSVRRTRGREFDTVELREGDLVTMDVTRMHRIRRGRGGRHDDGQVFACALLPSYPAKPSRDRVEKDLLRAFKP